VSIVYRAMYRFGFKPWDTGVAPPELKALIEGPDARTPGRALDLGCGTGTNAIYMAEHGWDVTAIDFTPRAIAIAQAKVAASTVRPRVMLGDVTRLDALGVGDGYSLVFDLGCLHSIPEARRDSYAGGVTTATIPGADFLVFGFFRNPNALTRLKLTQDELERRFGGSWEIVRAWGGEDPDGMPSRWYHLKRRYIGSNARLSTYSRQFTPRGPGGT
jgi:SAM-dependent methyltransferase